MSLVELRGTVLRWGNSFGLRLSRRDLDRLHVKPGSEIPILVPVAEGEPLDPMDAPTFRLGGHAADEHDALFGQAALDDVERTR
jgi:hypothetical protein